MSKSSITQTSNNLPTNNVVRDFKPTYKKPPVTKGKASYEIDLSENDGRMAALMSGEQDSKAEISPQEAPNIFYKKKASELYEAALNNKNKAGARGQYEEALQMIDTAIELNPNYLWQHFDQGLCLVALGRFEEAAQSFSQEIKINHVGDGPIWSHQERAKVYVRMDNLDLAEADLRKIQTLIGFNDEKELAKIDSQLLTIAKKRWDKQPTQPEVETNNDNEQGYNYPLIMAAGAAAVGMLYAIGYKIGVPTPVEDLMDEHGLALDETDSEIDYESDHESDADNNEIVESDHESDASDSLDQMDDEEILQEMVAMVNNREQPNTPTPAAQDAGALEALEGMLRIMDTGLQRPLPPTAQAAELLLRNNFTNAIAEIRRQRGSEQQPVSDFISGDALIGSINHHAEAALSEILDPENLSEEHKKAFLMMNNEQFTKIFKAITTARYDVTTYPLDEEINQAGKNIVHNCTVVKFQNPNTISTQRVISGSVKGNMTSISKAQDETVEQALSGFVNGLLEDFEPSEDKSNLQKLLFDSAQSLHNFTAITKKKEQDQPEKENSFLYQVILNKDVGDRPAIQHRYLDRTKYEEALTIFSDKTFNGFEQIYNQTITQKPNSVVRNPTAQALSPQQTNHQL